MLCLWNLLQPSIRALEELRNSPDVSPVALRTGIAF